MWHMCLCDMQATCELLKLLLDAGCVDPNERDPQRCGMTLLHLVGHTHIYISTLYTLPLPDNAKVGLRSMQWCQLSVTVHV